MFVFRVFAMVVMAVSVFGSLAVAAPEAVNVGSAIPALDLKDQNGVVQSFESVKGEKGAVIYFVRSADWCPYCQVQLLDIRDYGPQIEGAGYEVVTISYDAPGVLKDFVEKYSYPFTMLSDEGSAVIKAFGILNEDMKPGSPYYGIPHPTIYVVNADGVVQAKLAEEGYKTRPKAEDILGAIK